MLPGSLFSVEYCSYKGLTQLKQKFEHMEFLIVEYCSYKGLTQDRSAPGLHRSLRLNIVLIKD